MNDLEGKIRKVLVDLLGITIDNEHRDDLLRHKKDDIDQALSAILALFRKVVEDWAENESDSIEFDKKVNKLMKMFCS